MEIVDSVYTSLKTIGKDEKWILEWVIEKPSRLGLGDLDIKRHELIQHRNNGSRLEILAYRADINTFYEIELMLDECDADHGLISLDFWSRERRKHPTSKHIAVLIAEDLSCRYKPILDGLPQVLPFIGIEIRVLKLPLEDGVATILPSIIAQSPDLKFDHSLISNQMVKNILTLRAESVKQAKSPAQTSAL